MSDSLWSFHGLFSLLVTEAQLVSLWHRILKIKKKSPMSQVSKWLNADILSTAQGHFRMMWATDVKQLKDAMTGKALRTLGKHPPKNNSIPSSSLTKQSRWWIRVKSFWAASKAGRTYFTLQIPSAATMKPPNHLNGTVIILREAIQCWQAQKYTPYTTHKTTTTNSRQIATTEKKKKSKLGDIKRKWHV